MNSFLCNAHKLFVFKDLLLRGGLRKETGGRETPALRRFPQISRRVYAPCGLAHGTRGVGGMYIRLCWRIEKAAPGVAGAPVRAVPDQRRRRTGSPASAVRLRPVSLATYMAESASRRSVLRASSTLSASVM